MHALTLPDHRLMRSPLKHGCNNPHVRQLLCDHQQNQLVNQRSCRYSCYAHGCALGLCPFLRLAIAQGLTACASTPDSRVGACPGHAAACV